MSSNTASNINIVQTANLFCSDCSQPFRVDWYSDALSDKEAAGTATNDANEQSRGKQALTLKAPGAILNFKLGHLYTHV